MFKLLFISEILSGRYFGAGLIYALTVLLVACSSNQPEILPTTIGADRALYERGIAALEEGDWLRSTQYFTQVRDNYPQSTYRELSRLGLGDSHIAGGNSVTFVSATAEFQEFLRLFPTHPRADYAQFKLGLINFLQMLPPDRDQSFTRSAISDFESFISRYPNSELVPEVESLLREARDRLGASEVVVGIYYYRDKWWPGAISRLQPILDDDPDYVALDEVYFYLGASYREEGSSMKALELFERLLEEFPASDYVEDVKQALPELKTEANTDTENENNISAINPT